MKNKISKFALRTEKYLPIFILAALLSSITVMSFHSHHCDEESDNCPLCAFQQSLSSSSVTVESGISDIILHKPVLVSIITQYDRVTDPSQKTVCYSHAPPNYS